MTSKYPPPPSRPAPPVPSFSMSTPTTSAAPPAPSLQESISLSTESWQADLHALFRNTKEWFPDVVWEVGIGIGPDGETEEQTEEVWGHKAIVYARAPPSFQSRYFQFRPSNASNGALSPSPSHSPARTPTPTIHGNSALSLNFGASGLGMDMQLSRSPSPSRATSRANGESPAPSFTANGVPITRLRTSITPALFSNELEYLYTGQGFGEAFEFLFDDNGGELGLSLGEGGEGEAAQEIRLDKLRKDLVFMWRSRLYSDVKISLAMNSRPQSGGELTWTGWTGSNNREHENTTAVFSTHKFILVARSTYLRGLLLASPMSKLSPSLSSSLSASISSVPGSPPILTLPSPPFTPASLHFTLGYLYTGTLAFSHRTYDLTTALHIYLSALPMYLNLPALRDEVRGRIIVELCHGLFHAFLEFGEYEALVRGVRGGTTSVASKRMSISIGAIGGCRCRSCARRAPRILQFVSYLAGLKNVSDPYLDRGARRALVGLLGDGWVTSEWASMDAKLRDSVMRGVKKRVSAEVAGGSAGTGDTGGGNIWNMLFAVESALAPQGRLAKATASASKASRADKVMDDLDINDSREQADKNWHMVVRADLLRARDLIDEILAERITECFTAPPAPSVEEDVQYSEWHEILFRASPSYQQHTQMTGQNKHHRLASIVSSLSPSTFTSSNASDVSITVPSRGTLNNGTTPASAYEDANNVALILASLIRGLRPSNAPLVYQSLVSNVLLLRANPDPDTSGYQSMSIYDDDPYGTGGYGMGALLLPPTSHVRIQVEEARLEVLRWMSAGNRWKEIRDQGGFIGKEGEKDGMMESWALQEIADHLQVPVDEMLQPPTNAHSAGSPRVTSPTPSRDRLRPRNDSERDTVSIHSMNSVSPSMRVSILSKNLPLKSSANSVRSVDTMGRRAGRKTPTAAQGDRPDSKLTPQSVNITLEDKDDQDDDDGDDINMRSTPTPSTLISPPTSQSTSRATSRVLSLSPSPSTKRSRVTSPSPSTASNKRLASTSSMTSSRSSIRSVSSVTSSISPRAAAARSSPPARPRSASSTHSTVSTRTTLSKASTTSTVRRHARGGGGGLQVPPVPVPRPISTSTSGASRTSGSSTTSDFHTAPSSGTPRQRERTVSATSTGSVRSTRSARSTLSATPSTKSNRSTATGTGAGTKRPPSTAGSVKSLRVSPAEKARAQVKEAATAGKAANNRLPGKKSLTATTKTTTLSKKASTDTIKGEGSPKSSTQNNSKDRTLPLPPVPPLPSTSSSPTPSTPISPAAAPDQIPSPPTDTEPETEPYPTHLGATLSIGIPCIVTSKRRRFRAFARYIGEVEGERGPWVGVEVPINDSSEREKDKDVIMGDARPWNDGSWRGVRYFDILSKSQSGSGEADEEWGDGSYGDNDRPSTTRRRRVDREIPSAFTKGTKRRVDQWSGDSQSTSRYNTMSSKRMRMGMGVRSTSPSMSDGGYGMGATESRGLFVRPQQVLYVVDAIDGDDL
ncbi:hypothetical protein D9757_000905 [Collybiopsis confluens]|uniref:BTB domain-containing protein n=1 Tax=Collybiopsis confluens TaxID=2823264 RepID=A0A8H5MFT5_9AGAR|nr:hypothetical protein D9757_000905 [Collybiopsis confluens]